MAHRRVPPGVLRDHEACGELSEGVSLQPPSGSVRLGGCGGVVPQSGHKASLGLSTRVGQDNHDQPDETYGRRRHWTIALVRLRGRREHGERLRTADLVAADIRASAKAQPVARPRPPASATLATPPASGEAAATDTPQRRSPPDGAAVTLSGKSEAELRDMLGTPTSEEDRPPGKRWRYRDGQCTLDVQLYPDVQTKQFGTLAYEVKSDDNTDEGKRLCVAQIQSRVQARH